MSGDERDEQESEEELDKLLGALRTVAREDELAVARLPADAYAPLSAADRAGIADRILRAPQAAAPVDSPVIPIASRRPARRWVLAAVVGPLAAAAALVLLIRPFSGEQTGPLPAYDISASGGIREMRGAEPAAGQAPGSIAAPQRLRPDSRLVVVARPDVAVDGPIAVGVFLSQAGRTEEIRPQIQIAPSGAVEIRASAADVFAGRTGHWDLVVLIGRSKPSEPTARRLTVPVDIEAP